MPENPVKTSMRRRLEGVVALARRNPVETAVVSAAAILLLAFGVIAIYRAVRRPPDVRNTSAAFVPEEAKVKRKTVNWPIFGYDRRRTRYLAAKGIEPPFKKIWKYGDQPLLEFAPIVVDGRVYGLDNNGHAFAIDADSGKLLWKRRPGRLNASAPAYSHKRLFVVTLIPGTIRAINVRNGKTEWRKELGSRAESSPIVIGRRVFFGDEGGNLFAVDRRNGHTIWTAQLCGAIKAAPAYRHGMLYVGDYGGCMNAVNSHTGNIKWQSSSQGLSLGRTGAFYSTPAVAFGRVYSGNNDGRVYSFEADDGILAWSHSTGGYVYSGPAVADTPRTGPTVYIGSVDGNAYALDAKSGETRWSRSVGGRVLGSLSAVGNIVYAATYDDTTTYGFAMKDGHTAFKFGTGGANSPVVSDGRRIYLTGYSSITALQPLTRKQLKGRAKAKRERAQRKKARQRHRRRARAERQKKRAEAKQDRAQRQRQRKAQAAEQGGSG